MKTIIDGVPIDVILDVCNLLSTIKKLVLNW